MNKILYKRSAKIKKHFEKYPRTLKETEIEALLLICVYFGGTSLPEASHRSASGCPPNERCIQFGAGILWYTRFWGIFGICI